MTDYLKIGVMGGMGPETTAAFYREIIVLFQQMKKARYNYEFPEMMIHNVPSPDNVEDGVDDALLSFMHNSVRLLAGAGMDMVTIPCNSAHIHIDAVVAAAPIPVLNILEETSKAVVAQGCRHVLLLGTKSTLAAGLYNPYMTRAGIAYSVPNSADQDIITQAIMRVCNGTVDKAVRQSLRHLIGRFPQADGVVLGCTELPLALSQQDCDIPVFNTSAILAEATYRYCVRETPLPG